MFAIYLENIKENQRENNISLIFIRSAGRQNNDIYSLSEFRDVMNGAFGTQQFTSQKKKKKICKSIGCHPAHSISELHI